MKKIEWKHKPHRVSKDDEMLEGLSEEEVQALQQPTLSRREKKKRRKRTKRSRASRRKQRKKK